MCFLLLQQLLGMPKNNVFFGPPTLVERDSAVSVSIEETQLFNHLTLKTIYEMK
jgi:hypothetical protein